MRDFQNKAVQDEWNKFRASVLVQRNERSQRVAQTVQRLEQERQARAVERSQRSSSLNDTIDGLNAKFADAAVALEYDANRLAEIYANRFEDGRNGELDSMPLPCLGPRAHWIDCQKKYAVEPSPCDAYAETLRKCVNETIQRNNEKHG